MILRFESKRGGRGSLFLINGVVEGCVAASVDGDVLVCDTEEEDDAGGISVSVAWKF